MRVGEGVVLYRYVGEGGEESFATAAWVEEVLAPLHALAAARTWGEAVRVALPGRLAGRVVRACEVEGVSDGDPFESPLLALTETELRRAVALPRGLDGLRAAAEGDVAALLLSATVEDRDLPSEVREAIAALTSGS